MWKWFVSMVSMTWKVYFKFYSARGTNCNDSNTNTNHPKKNWFEYKWIIQKKILFDSKIFWFEWRSTRNLNANESIKLTIRLRMRQLVALASNLRLNVIFYSLHFLPLGSIIYIYTDLWACRSLACDLFSCIKALVVYSCDLWIVWIVQGWYRIQIEDTTEVKFRTNLVCGFFFTHHFSVYFPFSKSSSDLWILFGFRFRLV